MIRRMIAYPLLAYLVWCGGLYFLQDQMIFPGPSLPFQGSNAVPNGVEQIWITGADHTSVEGWFIRGEERNAQHPGPAVIYMHGNGELIDACVHNQEIQGYLHSGISVLLPEYRGYGRSQGTPSEKDITQDMEQFYEWLETKPEVNRKQIIFHGRSLGGGVATALASRRKPAALILESTFTSIASFGYRYGLPSFLCRHPFRTDRLISTLDCPILISHGSRDEVIPVSHGRQLHKLAPGSEYIEINAGHNDRSVDWEGYWKAIETFLRRNQVMS